MRRVSSRQRLVSWDAFDATATSDSESGIESSGSCENDGFDVASYNSGYETAQSQSFHSSTAPEGLSGDNFEIQRNDESDPKEATLSTKCRKRDRQSLRSNCAEHIQICKNVESPKTPPPITFTEDLTIVPSFSWENGQTTPPKMVHFDDLIDDLHIDIFSFLDLSSLRSVMSTNKHYRNLTISNDARSSLWMDHCERIWHLKRKCRNEKSLKFIDDFRLPIAVTPTSSPILGTEVTAQETDTTNLSLLLSLSPAKFPTSIDQDILKPRKRLSRFIQQTIPAYRIEEEDQLIRCYQDSLTGRSVVRYTGYVGQGDRCVRTNHPLPRPSRSTGKCISSIHKRNELTVSGDTKHNDPFRPFLLTILRCSSKSTTRESRKVSTSLSSLLPSTSQPPFEWTPFVVPFVDQCINETSTAINVTPRFVSYFEVTIFRLEDNNNSNDSIASDAVSQTQRRSPPRRTSYSDCVAVGVATKSFQFQSRMPGWDQQSYGYHGDDGGIFHASGGMIKQFGPKYGPGDTVGCGIDYVSKGIFYTLNGEFLGYAWERVSDDVLEKELFPVVGLDTNSPIHLNLGSAESGPFQFDLSSFIKRHENIITTMYSLDGFDCLGDADAVATKESSVGPSTKKIGSFSGLSSSRRQRRNLVGRRNHRDR